MSLGPIMLDVAGTELTPEDRDLLRHPLVGGVILFTRNYANPEQLEALVGDIHALREPHLLVAVDHEGGRVQRFRDGFTRLPAVREFGRIYERDRKQAKRLAEVDGWLMASELRAVGVDFSFAPVLDLDYGVSQVIGDRAFHGNAEVVADLAHSFMHGMQHAGMAAVGKHFPGHGYVQVDSHLAVPVDGRRYEDIYADDILPFARMIRFGLAAIMPAHVVYSQVAPEPAGFSPRWIQDVLRQRLEFQGAVLSDDLSMMGARVMGDVVQGARAALHAGCDMVLVCNDRQAAQQVVDGLGAHPDPVSCLRLARLHGRHPIARADLLHSRAWHKAAQQMDELAAGKTLDLGI